MPKETRNTAQSYEESKDGLLKKSREMCALYKRQWKEESHARVADKDILRAEIKSLKKHLAESRAAHESDKQVFSQCLVRVDANLFRAKQQRAKAQRMAKAGWIGFYVLASSIIITALLS